MEGIVPRQKLWLERDGLVVMSGYRMRLLQLVDESGSLARAAAEMGLSYRRAWGKVKEIEHNLGVELVHSEVGGAGGGNTALTPAGRALLRAYERFQARLEAELTQVFAEELSAIAEER